MSGPRAQEAWELPLAADDPAWAAQRRLAEAVRRLGSLTVETGADAATLDALAERVALLAGELAGHPHERPSDAFASGAVGVNPDRFRDKGAMLGRSNPVSGPLVLRREGERIVGEATFDSIHGGAPGFLHGGLVATVLDEVLGYVAIVAGAMVVTSSLTVRYLKPTPLYQPLRAEAWLVAQEGRRWTTAGHLRVGDRVTAEAEGVFVDVGGEKFRKMFGEAVG